MDEVKTEINNGTAVLLDVRNLEEWDESHALCALHIPLDKLVSEYDNNLVPKQKVYIYCGSGKRAGVAKTILDTAGFKTKNLGGLDDWVRGGGEVVSRTVK